jgi:hypothetical protein
MSANVQESRVHWNAAAAEFTQLQYLYDEVHVQGVSPVNSWDDRNHLIDVQDHLLHLLVQYDEAVKAENPRRRSALELQIEAAKARRNKLRGSE